MNPGTRADRRTPVLSTAEAELTAESQVTFARSGETASWDPACESILGFAERQGLNLALSRRSGIRHAYMCELTLSELTEVEFLDEPLDEPDPDHILICCSRPTSKLAIDV